MSRTLQVGSVEYVWATITETGGQDLAVVGVELAVTAYGVPPVSWAAADVTQHAGSTVRAARLVTAAQGADPYGRWSVWARLTDTPEVPILDVGTFTVR